mgnify:CR=1 FL=1
MRALLCFVLLFPLFLFGTAAQAPEILDPPQLQEGMSEESLAISGKPKLDGSYGEKLAGIFRHNRIRSITVTRMQVPCCGGLPFAVKTALEQSGKQIPCRVVTISADGHILA